jgi:uridine kinase
MKTITIGVAGGSGSGKTTVALNILEKVGVEHIAYISHDAYYRDWTLPFEERVLINYDHPDAFDNELLIEHIQKLQHGEAIESPTYDFKAYARAKETRRVEPASVILIDGFLIFADKKLRDLMNIKIFVDTDSDLRFIRRLQRDMVERGRTAESVIKHYQNTVRPMHLEFVEPSKRYADVIIPEGGFNSVAIEMVAAQIKSIK